MSPRLMGEGELLLVVELLVVEDEHGVLVHAGVDGRDLVRGQRLGQVDAFHFRGEARADLAGDHGHGGQPPSRVWPDSRPIRDRRATT